MSKFCIEQNITWRLCPVRCHTDWHMWLFSHVTGIMAHLFSHVTWWQARLSLSLNLSQSWVLQHHSCSVIINAWIHSKGGKKCVFLAMCIIMNFINCHLWQYYSYWYWGYILFKVHGVHTELDTTHLYIIWRWLPSSAQNDYILTTYIYIHMTILNYMAEWKGFCIQYAWLHNEITLKAATCARNNEKSHVYYSNVLNY